MNLEILKTLRINYLRAMIDCLAATAQECSIKTDYKFMNTLAESYRVEIRNLIIAK